MDSDTSNHGHRRGLRQVLANGGVATVMVALFFMCPHEVFFAAFLGAIAAATADTWATELGKLSRQPPRDIITRKTLPTGTSGAVTCLGHLASLAGSAFIGIGAPIAGFAGGFIGEDYPFSVEWTLILCLFAGFLGSTIDSILGATLQGRYYCERCRQATEQRRHFGGHATLLIEGWAWVDNDMVNLANTVSGALIAALGYLFWSSLCATLGRASI